MAIKRKKKRLKPTKTLQPKKGTSSFRQRLYGRKGGFSPKLVFRDLQANRDFKEMSAAAEYVSNRNNPLHRFVFGIPFPKSFADFYSTSFSVFTNNLQRDLDWISLSILRYSKQISSFIEKSSAFEKAFLLGSYDEASGILQSIFTEFGPSLWGMEKSFLLLEYSSGMEANKELLSSIVGDKANDEFLKIIAEYVSLRCESKLSVENYRLRLLRFLEDFEGELANIGAYFSYRLEPLGSDLLPIAPLVTTLEGPLPLVDRYLTFINILQICTAHGEGFVDISETVTSRFEGFVQDPRMDALLHYYNPGRTFKWEFWEKDLLSTLDSYTEGDCKTSEVLSAELLAEHPNNFDLYYIYIRSQDYLGKPFQQLFSEGSVAGSILEHCNLIVRGESSWKESSNIILKHAMSLGRDQLAYGLYDFYIKEVFPTQDDKLSKLALLNTLPFNPRFATIYTNPDMADTYLDQLSYQAGRSSTLSLTRVLTVTSQKDENFEMPKSIPETRRRVFSGAVHESAGRYQRAISIMKPLLSSIGENNLQGGFHTGDRVITALFRCYLETKKLSDCTDLAVSSYLRNELSVRKVPLDQLASLIDETSPQEVMRKITYPILYSIVHTKARSIYIAYDNFLNSIGVSRPTQLFDISDQFDKKEFREFLFRVCTIDVLACSYHFNGTKDLESERIRICQYLLEKYPERSKKYSDEISSITSRSLIRDGIRQIHVSRIYVDETGIRVNGRKLLEESFIRYRELASMSNIDTLRMLNETKGLHLYTLTANGEIVKKPITIEELEHDAIGKRVVHKSLYLLYKELFLDIRDRFISSGEHGLDGYLSVRIRHGVLQNQIRSIFELLHLISEKDTTTGEYLPNDYWAEKLNELPENDISLVQELLAIFSRDVDEAAQRLNTEMIQVKTEKKNPEGLFDYTFSHAELLSLFEEQFVDIEDFEQFLDETFRVLWSRTKDNLEKIRKVISSDLKESIFSSISHLDREVRRKISPDMAVELLQNIPRCQTDLQYALQNISEWFTISRSSLVPQISIKDLVNICIESINNIYPHKKISPNINFDGDVIIDGRFFAPFFDIVRTLLDNVLVHSGVKPSQMAVELNTIVSKERLGIKIKNCLSEDVRKLDPVLTLSATHDLLQPSDINKIIATEGRSGLLKVRKILAIDLQRKDSFIDFSYDENENFIVSIEMELEGLENENSNH